MKNYPLSVPLMNYVYVSELKTEYINDKFDTLQINEHILYANMWKELCNNAIQFGVLKNCIWVLGYSKYVELGDQIIKNKTGNLKLGVLVFSSNAKFNTLTAETTRIRFFSCSENSDIINNINDFIGVYFNKYNLNLEFILYNSNKHIEYLKNNKIEITTNNYVVSGIPIPIRVRILFNGKWIFII
jgi:hypothetical protein